MFKIRKSKYPYRCLARVIIEAATPLAIGSGSSAIYTDRLVVRDVNGLPCLPGTSLAGVLRHAVADENPEMANQVFGHQTSKDTCGSLLTVSEGRVLKADGVAVMDGILTEPLPHDDYYELLRGSIVRQHARIGHKGSVEKRCKFDEEVVPKGVRFCFELEMLAADEAEIGRFQQILHYLGTADFRLGGGTRNGLGQLRVAEALVATLDLRDEDERRAYLNKSNDLNVSSNWPQWKAFDIAGSSERYDTYTLRISPVDFFFFGSGMGDEETDAAPLKERFIEWNDDTLMAHVTETYKILPASSLKGLLSHRTAYHYNRLTQTYAHAGTVAAGADNQAVTTLFGSEGDNDGKGRKRGQVIFSDLISRAKLQTKTFNHVSISQFTGGALQGKLFDENTIDGRGCEFQLDILVPKEGIADSRVRESFEMAMRDVCESRLPLGGMVNRGHGMFKGELLKNNVRL